MVRAKFTEIVSNYLAKEEVPTDEKKLIGWIGEKEAKKFLLKKGYKFVEKNWHCRAGEIDLIFTDGNDLVFVEVKSRRKNKNAKKLVFSNIDSRKKHKLRKLADIYLICHKNFKNHGYRVDVIGVIVDIDTRKPVEIEHIISAV